MAVGTAHWELTVVKENNSKLIRGDVHSDNDSNNVVVFIDCYAGLFHLFLFFPQKILFFTRTRARVTFDALLH